MADLHLVRALRDGKQAFQQWQGTNQGTIADLSGADLSNLTAENIVLERANLSKQIFKIVP
jgi:uncharacterized protein YjbI with pentapeptide repeats